MKISILFLLFINLVVIASDSDRILQNVKDKYASLKNFTAEIRQQGNNLNGTLYYSKGNKFRLELKNTTIVSDGTTLWNFNKKDNKVVIDNASSGSANPFSVQVLLNDYPLKCNVTSSSDGKQSVIKLVPKSGSGLNFLQVSLWITQDNLIERALIENPNGNNMNFTISGYKLNQEIPDSKFTFDPPKGSSIIDLR